MKSETRNPKPEGDSGATQHATRNTPLLSRIMHHASRYLSIYAALWKNSVAREMSFKSNFLLWILVELLWFGLQLSFISVLYLHTDHAIRADSLFPEEVRESISAGIQPEVERISCTASTLKLEKVAPPISGSLESAPSMAKTAAVPR